MRRRLPADRHAICHKFDIAGHEGYIHVGFFEDGTPGEIFIKMAKEGSTISGLMDTVGVLTSMALQYGVPLEVLVSKFSHVRFEPSGFTKNPDIPMAKSLIDYIFRFLGDALPVGRSARRGRAGGARSRACARVADGRAGGRGARPAARLRPADAGQRAIPSASPTRPGVDAGAHHVQPAGRRTELPRLRIADGAQRGLLQVLQLRGDQRLLLSPTKRA